MNVAEQIFAMLKAELPDATDAALWRTTARMLAIIARREGISLD